MPTCSHCGHHLWLTAGVRACGSCDLMGEWPRINGSATVRPYDWEEEETA